MDPIVSGALVSAVNEGSKEAAKVNAGLLERALGPTADVIGAELAGWTERRLKNAGRLADRAAEKAELTGRTGEANLRTAHAVLEEGSFADGSLAAEYFSGVLASSKTPDGQDDRGVFWSNVVASLSTAQLRLHFLLYRNWLRALHGERDLNLAMPAGRSQARAEMPLVECMAVVCGQNLEVTPEGHVILTPMIESTFRHAVTGLAREGLISDTYSYGAAANLPDVSGRFPLTFMAEPSMPGFELFCWVLGLPDLSSTDLLSIDPQILPDQVPFDDALFCMPRLAQQESASPI